MSAFFFFSGHGVQMDRRGYIAPVDMQAESESSALRELRQFGGRARIENAAEVRQRHRARCLPRIVHLQQRMRRIAVEKNKSLVPPKGWPPVSVVGSDTVIVYATVAGETASDGTGRNSPFTPRSSRTSKRPAWI